ncbi:UDP-3-O-[3-hydroxymyristoyl] glucosamine N-acyltransferase [Hydrogenispora ethanolica]|jgi:UDP-3-O-[3-hydroxymyristoyl] glucosamine N-acyltransferase|uniref:UDP-3-O-acylglucosamine N-acyltransferase n=1 Tax=Hydrogenispora ethanolica TaxID=1082276 RepID=A0A4R1R9Z6_HYDET|nr:UDP-3-O-(3-hydroxymyristoyl)glucosamine N-acyltransferase [Hydrogenispora ethanolica]TCL62212.1 UDP-3-O-[3-hydroxymyristoyl] glucosamine N-acyltransferase [Hydrogenispora ethanolica]
MTSLSDLANLVHGELVGDGRLEITGAAGFEDVRAGEITFAASMRAVEPIINSCAAAVIVPTNIENIRKPAIRVVNPRLAFAQILAFFHPSRQRLQGIHPSAVIGKGFCGDECAVGALCFIGDDVTIGRGSVIYPGAVIMDRVQIGDNSIIHANVVVREDCVIGKNVQIHAGSVIGADGFVYVTENGRHHKVPEVGNVVIEDDVEIGANVTIDRATTGVTLIQRGTKIDNLVQIAHNCRLGEDNLIMGQVGIAGGTKLGERVTLSGKAAVIERIKIGADSVIAANALVINSLPANSFVSGIPARPHAADMRIQATAGRLPELLREFKELQKKVADLEERIFK